MKDNQCRSSPRRRGAQVAVALHGALAQAQMKFGCCVIDRENLTRRPAPEQSPE
ncbi:MAG: hypothetical protein N2C14_14450 [Planctomycetales bacterium]